MGEAEMVCLGASAILPGGGRVVSGRYPTALAVRGCAGTVISSATLGSTLGSIDCAWARRNPARGAPA